MVVLTEVNSWIICIQHYHVKFHALIDTIKLNKERLYHA